ncbi:hypothetical protein [Methylocystis echinoides]|uniref:hypothetical protein n=1 Tax=Methylocystis echinoides TaxID=29468 RepID=UPI00341A2750
MALHVRRDANAEPSVFARVAIEVFGRSPAPDAFPERLPVKEGFLHALSYAEREGIAVVWIDDPLGLFPPERRPVIAMDKRAEDRGRG